MRSALALLLVAVVATSGTAAQVRDDFSDGDFSTNPEWSGDVEKWAITPFGRDFALRINGVAASDTVFLSTASAQTFGTWRTPVAYEGGRLSNFNQARIHVMASDANLTKSKSGYYLQLGTNNRDIRLYRVSDSDSDARVLLARSIDDILPLDQALVEIVVTRTPTNVWFVYLDGQAIIELQEDQDAIGTSGYFGLWVKHSASRNHGFHFDDIEVSDSALPDITPPSLVAAEYIPSTNIVELRFSEPLAESSISPASFTIDHGIGHPTSVVVGDPESGPKSSLVTLTVEAELPDGEYSVSATDVSDRNANIASFLFATFSVVSGAAGQIPLTGDIVINEILYNPAVSAVEYVELLNVSTRTFELSEFEFSDDRRVRRPVATTATIIAPGEYAVLVRDPNEFASSFPLVSYVAPPSWPALNNSGDASILYYDDTTVDSVAFEASWGGSGVSLERRDPDGPSAARSNWGSSVHVDGGTPGRINSIFEPDRTAPVILFAELIDGRTVRIEFDEPISATSLLPSNFTIDGNPANAIALSADGMTANLLYSQVPSKLLVVRHVADLTGNYITESTIAIARQPLPGDILITEILYDPRADATDGLVDQTEFVEIFNSTNDLLTTSGLFWSDEPDENNEADTARVNALRTSLAAGSYGVLFAQPAAITSSEVYTGSELVLAFPRDYASENATLLPHHSASLGLLNAGGLFRLHRADDTTLDEVFYDPNWHHPNLRISKGISLERIDLEGLSSDDANWSSSVAPAGATPGFQNSIFHVEQSDELSAPLTVHPTPFSPDHDGVDDFAAIQYRLRTAAPLVRVRIFDSHGRKVRELEQGRLSSGWGTVVWNGRDDRSNELRVGIYVVLLEAVDSGSGVTEVHKAAVVLARQLN